MLPADSHAAPAQREQHCMRGDGGVSDERRFLTGVEETQANVVVRCSR
jgi:hypothetical protein